MCLVHSSTVCHRFLSITSVSVPTQAEQLHSFPRVEDEWKLLFNMMIAQLISSGIWVSEGKMIFFLKEDTSLRKKLSERDVPHPAILCWILSQHCSAVSDFLSLHRDGSV